MTLYSAKATIAENPAFIGRVEVAIVEAAIAITNEDPGTVNHDARVHLARRIINSPGTWARHMAIGVTTNPNTGTGVSDPAADTVDGDSALAFVVASIWDSYMETNT